MKFFKNKSKNKQIYFVPVMKNPTIKFENDENPRIKFQECSCCGWLKPSMSLFYIDVKHYTIINSKIDNISEEIKQEMWCRECLRKYR